MADRHTVLQVDPEPVIQFSGLGLQSDFTPITKFSDRDIFLAAYPKSGNTWFQNLITGIYFGVDPELAPDTLIQELVPDIHFKKCYRRFKTPMFFKTHNLPRPEYKRVIYLVRDGRDVMVSYYHHQMAVMKKEIDFMAMVRDGKDLFPSKWHEHVQAWNTNPYNAEKIVIKYEKLKDDPLTVLTQFCDFAQIERGQAFLRHAIKQANFAKLQAKERDGRMFFASDCGLRTKPFFVGELWGAIRMKCHRMF